MLNAPGHPHKRIKLGNSTRDAIEVSPNSSFEASIAPGASYLDVGIGARGHAETDFEVAVVGTSPPQMVFRKALKPNNPDWADERIDLKALGGQARTLRFTVSNSDPGDQARAYWGSPVLLECGSRSPMPPNVILISLDTLGADHLTAFGNRPGVSPHIDTFLRRGFSFRRAYVQYPNTLVSHASMLTGLYPIHHGVYEGNPVMPRTTVATILAAHGYRTAAITEDAYVSSDFGFDHGFDRYDNGVATDEEHAITGNAARTFAQATEWLDALGNTTRFFLFVHTYEVHTPYIPRDAEAWSIANAMTPGYQGPLAQGYKGGMIEILNNSGKFPMGAQDRARAAALYSGEINYLDRLVGRFLEHVAQSGYAADTLVVLTADHGDEFGEHGMLGHGETLFNPVLHVPLAFYWKDHTATGEDAHPVQSVDIVPTILDLLGIRPQRSFDGTSLAKLILGDAETLTSRPAFAELKALPFAAQRAAEGRCEQFGVPPDCQVYRRAVQTERYKLIRSKFPPYEHLYDLAKDPGETADVSATQPNELRQLADYLDEYESGRAPPTPANPPPTLDDSTRERLRALGYVE